MGLDSNPRSLSLLPNYLTRPDDLGYPTTYLHFPMLFFNIIGSLIIDYFRQYYNLYELQNIVRYIVLYLYMVRSVDLTIKYRRSLRKILNNC